MSLLLALQGGAPAITGTVVQGATKGQHVAVAVETFSGTVLQRGMSAPTVALATETFSATGVQRGVSAPTIASGTETFSGSGVQVGRSAPTVVNATALVAITGTSVMAGLVGQTVAEGTVGSVAPARTPAVGYAGFGHAADLWRPQRFVQGAGSGVGSVGQSVAQGTVTAPNTPIIDPPTVKRAEPWRMVGDVWVPEEVPDLEPVEVPDVRKRWSEDEAVAFLLLEV